MNPLNGIGIMICLFHSAMFSGMNLGIFSLSKMELSVEARQGNAGAKKMLKLRENSNYTLVTILWGNVAVNVLLAMLSDSVLSGVAAFLFATVVITIFAEIIPQAYFSRYALRLAVLLLPLLRFYQILLYPLARPIAWALDRLLGGEEIRYFRERDIRQLIKIHMHSSQSDIDRVEGQGALNFLEIDDVPLIAEGESVDPDSIIKMEFDGIKPVFPVKIKPNPDDAFLKAVARSGKSWVIIVDSEGNPRLVLKTDDFIREAVFSPKTFNPYRHCHRPLITKQPQMKLRELIMHFKVRSAKADDDIIEDDVILLWGENPRVVTGTDILGRLLRGIAIKSDVN